VDETSASDQTATQAESRPEASLRKLNADQEREVARLYAETPTSIADLARQFGISDSSVYRVIQRHGVKRRRTGGGRPSGGGRRSAATGGTRRAAGRRTGQASRRRGGQPAAARSASAGRDSGRRRYRVTFVAEAVVEADNVRDAVAQAEARGATEITAVTHEV
jgi:transposase-like protein